MTAIATIVALALAFVTVVATGLCSLRDQAVGRVELAAGALLEIGVLFYVGVRATDLVDGHRPPSLGLAVAYLVGIVLVMPVAAALGIAERSRWGAVVIGVGALVVCVLFARVNQVWTPHG
jgi:hypothetical protein